jgi:hypothetical protein
MIFACRLRDDLVTRARAGDAEALERLVRLLPRDLPASERRAARARAIQRMGQNLRAALPGAGNRRIARILTLAGEQLEAEHTSLSGPEFDDINRNECDWLAAEIRHVLSWSPADRDGRRWPKYSRIEKLLR